MRSRNCETEMEKVEMEGGREGGRERDREGREWGRRGKIISAFVSFYFLNCVSVSHLGLINP